MTLQTAGRGRRHRIQAGKALAICLAWTLVSGGTAQAQSALTPLAGESPTSGIQLPKASLTAGADAAAVELNPGALALVPSWSVLVHHMEISRHGRAAGGGDAVLLSTPLPLLKSLSFGAGLQWLRPAHAVTHSGVQHRDTHNVKLSLALSWRYRRWLSLGLAYHTFFSNSDEALNSLHTMDLGLVVRPFEWLGAGLVVRNLTTPHYAGYPLQRVYELELTARPLGNHRLELGAALRLEERRLELDPRFLLAAEPLDGLRLFGHVDLLHRDFNRDNAPFWDVRAMVGLELHLERVGVALSTLLGRDLSNQSAGPLAGEAARSVLQGVGVTLRVDGARRAPLFNIQKSLLVLNLNSSPDEHTMIKLVALLRKAEQRPDIHGVLLKLAEFKPGWANAQELRNLLARLRQAGKVCYAYVQDPGIKDYYLAAAADQVLLDPAGGLRLQGIAMRSLHFRGLFDKVGVSAQFVRIAQFKSAPEAYTQSTASPPVRKMREALLQDLFDQVIADLAADRKKSAAQLRKIIDQGPFTPVLAKAAGLVDHLVAPSKLASYMEEQTGARLISPKKLRRRSGRWAGGPSVAVILVEGDIVQGRSLTIPLLDHHLVGDETIIKSLQWARGSDSVKAVVLRVNSPGGSALASHHIWQEVAETRKVKPVVVSLGDMAASGGYYVAAAGDRIFAQPSTFTGSIGIFTGKFDLSGLMDKVGITLDAHTRGKRALMESFHRPYTKEERAFILTQLKYYYDQFTQAVAQGRKLKKEQVDKVARGRVWTGKQARARGLVDAQGGLTEAIGEAKKRAGYEEDRPLRLMVLPRVKKSLLTRALEYATGSAAASPWLHLPGPVKAALRGIPAVLFRHVSGHPLARLPFQLQY